MSRSFNRPKTIFIHESLKRSLLLALIIMGFAGCTTFNTFMTESRLRDQQVVIDGKSDDWQGDIFVVDRERVSLGFLNDEENLYICLLAEDSFTRAQIMMLGLTVWFDPQGGKEKGFGIKYPLGMSPGEMSMPLDEERGGEEFKNIPAQALDELEIIKSEKEKPQKMKVEEAKGIEIKVIPSSGLLVYELKIPLIQKEENVVSANAKPGETVGIGFETGKFDPTKMRQRGRGQIPGGGGMPPMGGFGRGGMGGIRMGGGIPEGIKIWAVVRLASSGRGQRPELLSLSK